MRRIPALVLVTVLLAGALVSILTAIAVVVALRDSLTAQVGPVAAAAAGGLVREMLFWAFVAWVPIGGVLAWWAGRRIAAPLEETRAFAREQAWSEHPPRRTQARILEVKRLEEALSGYFADLRDELAAALQSREDTLVLLNAVSEGILQLDERGRLRRLNPAAARLLHLPGEALGQGIASLVRHPELRALLQAPLPAEAVESTEVLVEGRNLLVGRQPLPPPGAGTLVVVVDLTALRRLESVRRDFVANVSHELKTPLTAIRGYVETLQDPELTPEQRAQFLEATLRNAERLQRIIDDLLDLSRIESGGWRPHLAAVDVPALAADAWSDFAPRAQESGVAFQLEGGGPAVTADPGGLRQILCNLFDNALRYSAPGGTISVRVRPRVLAGGPSAGRGTSQVSIEVSDTGAGIPAEALPRIFERFYRVDASRSRAEGGTGLGLSIVKHLAERMGGDVVAESRLGSGTTVRVTLPSAAPVLLAGSE